MVPSSPVISIGCCVEALEDVNTFLVIICDIFSQFEVEGRVSFVLSNQAASWDEFGDFFVVVLRKK